MIAFTIFSVGLYLPIWFLRRRAALNQLDAPRTLARWPFVAVLATFALHVAAIVAFGPARGAARSDMFTAISGLFQLANMACGVLMLVQCFFVRDMLQDHLAGPDDVVPTGFGSEQASVSGVLTFLFTIYYLQYVINTRLIGLPVATVA